MICFIFFFCKQKTAYEVRISDWSSDVCSSDLAQAAAVVNIINATRQTRGQLPPVLVAESQSALMDKLIYEKRMETYLLCSGCAYFDRRGFGPVAPTDRKSVG